MPMTAVARGVAPADSLLTQQHPAGAAREARPGQAGHAVARLEAGKEASSIVPAKTIDMASSPDPDLVAADRTRHVLEARPAAGRAVVRRHAR
jgi:hypothetical protein